MLGMLKVYAHFQRDENDTDTLLKTFQYVNVVSDDGSTEWTATDGVSIVARLQTYDDFPVRMTETAVEIKGILLLPQGKPTGHGDHYGHWVFLGR